MPNNRTTKSFLIAEPPNCSINVVAGYSTSYGQAMADVSVAEQIGRGNGNLKFAKWYKYGFRWRVDASGPGVEAAIELFERIASALRELRDEHNANSPEQSARTGKDE
jgi:hypothetical protein